MLQQDRTEVQKMIDDTLKSNFAQHRIGDTPTDALQIANKKYVDSKTTLPIYYGNVNSDGTKGTPFPSGWSITKFGTGQYRVVHNLGTTSYVVVLTNYFGAAGLAISEVSIVSGHAANSFEAGTFQTSNAAATDCAFSFMVFKGTN